MRGTGEKSEQYGDKHEKNTPEGAATYRSDMAAVFPMNRWTEWFGAVVCKPLLPR